MPFTIIIVLSVHARTTTCHTAVKAGRLSLARQYSTALRAVQTHAFARTTHPQAAHANGKSANEFVVSPASSAARIITNNSYLATDLSLEGSLLAGALGGYVTGLSGGILISIPAMMHGEYLSMVLLAGVGVLGGLLRDVAPNSDEIWRFSPFFDINVYNLLRRKADNRTTIFQLLIARTLKKLL